jgi:uncharacterized protein YbaP (TraB family)
VTAARLRGSLAAAALALAGWLLPAHAAEPACPPPLQEADFERIGEQLLTERAPAARDRGFMWHLWRDGRSSWLYGTLHLGRAEWIVPGPRLRDALQEADALVLELDPLDNRPADAAPAPAAAPALALSASQRARLGRQLERLCAQALADAPLHPTMKLMMASVLGARADGLEVAFGSELLLSTWAQLLRKPVLTLESAARQMEALVPAEPAAQAREFEQLLQQLEQGRDRPVGLRLVRAWEEGRLDELERYEQWCDCTGDDAARAQTRRLLDDRHPAMVERIDAWHKGGRSLFVAVGALHLIGPRGLPALQAQRGFNVDRVSHAP